MKPDIENILNSDLALCPSGNGKFSYRLYESLALGVIPVVFDDCLYPFQTIDGWENCVCYCRGLFPIVDILEFWMNKVDNGNLMTQKSSQCKRLYKEYFRADAWVNWQIDKLRSNS